ncbi:MAG: D-alanyl-D-alanine carboxypeptidase family protein [Cytophagales bacterium]|nr:D-alanyl-D-alanine carboxypeptidase family protein [Armatimonadota bacterium]
MPRSFGEPLTKLRAVPIQENGEPLVDPRTLSKRIHFAAKHPRFETMPRTPRVRKRVAEMLAEAAGSLPPGIDLKILEGFRPLHQQRFMYESLKKAFADKHPQWSRATLHRVTNQMSAPPDDPCPPPHSTGGAVDLFLFDTRSGEDLDMVSPLEWDETSAPTTMKGLSETAQNNRRLLIGVLEPTGLTNYTGEWWHWSYGDSGWALRTGARFAQYDRLPEN